MTAIPGVSNNDLIRTSWGQTVRSEINDRCLKLDGMDAIGTTARGMNGTLIVQASPTLRLRQGGNVPIINFENTSGAGGGGSLPFAFINGQSDGLHYQANVGGHRFLLATGVEVMELASGVLKVTGLGRFGVTTATEAVQVYGITAGNNYAHIGFFPSATSVDSVGTQGGYVGYNGAGLTLGADSGNVTVVSTAGAANLTADLGVNLTAGTQITLDATTTTTIGGGTTVTVTGTDITLDASDVLTIDGATAIVFQDSGTEVCRTVAGFLLVGKTTTDVSTEGVAIYETGTVSATRGETGGNAPVICNREGDPAAGQVLIQFCRNGTQIGRIEQTGTTGVAIADGSDRRMKTIVGPITDAVERVKALKPYRVTWNGDPSRGETDAFIADEVQSIVPEAVFGEANAVTGPPVAENDPPAGTPIMQGMSYDKLMTVTIAALQDALTQIEDLTDRIDALEGQPQ